MALIDQFTADEKNDAQAAFEIALNNPDSKQAREYLTYLREQDPEISDTTVFNQALLESRPYEIIESLQIRWMAERRKPVPAA